MGFLFPDVTYKLLCIASHRAFLAHSFCFGHWLFVMFPAYVSESLIFFPQIGKEVSAVVITVVSCLVPILKSPEVNDF
jgi:hypothetical protein